MNADHRTPAEQVADHIIALVQETQAGGLRGDSASQMMVGAYVQGFRRFTAIRMLAGQKSGPEALILARTLLSMTARATYVDAPSDEAERKRRFFQFRAKELNEAIKNRNRLTAAGFDVGATTLEAELAEIPDVGVIPDDTRLMLADSSLAPFHAKIYGPGSEHVTSLSRWHFRSLLDVSESTSTRGTRNCPSGPLVRDPHVRQAP